MRISDWSSDVCSSDLAEVFNPATGEVEKRVPLASAAELDAAVANAREAQPAWAAVNPQRRARVLMKFVELLHRDMDKLAEALSREHGKTLPDAKGDVIRGLEVAERSEEHTSELQSLMRISYAVLC